MSTQYPCNCPCMDCIEGTHCGEDSDAAEFGQPEVKFSCGYWWIPMEREEEERTERERDFRFFGIDSYDDDDGEYYEPDSRW